MHMFCCLLLLTLGGGLAQGDEPASAGTPGVSERCDVIASCIPYESRVQYSVDFLCCEGGPWVAAHILNPMGVAFFFGGFQYGLAAAFLWEVYEVTSQIYLDGFVVFPDDPLGLETLAGAVYGDAFIMGSIGSFLYVLLARVYGVLGPMHKTSDFTWWMIIKYWCLLAAFSVTFVFYSHFETDGGDRYGVFVALALQGLHLLFFMPLLTSYRKDNRIVWVQSGKKIKPEHRERMFRGMFVVCALLSLQAFGRFDYLANDWYQMWVLSGVIAIVLIVMKIQRSRKEASRKGLQILASGR